MATTVDLEHCGGDYIVTLNNDTRVESDWLEVLVRTAETHPRKPAWSDAGSARSTTRISSIRLAWVSVGTGCHGGDFATGAGPSLQLHEVEEILFPSACAALYSRSMIDEIGFFDDDFFAYAEDSDLGLRGRLAGWKAVLATRAVVYHKYSQSSGSFSSLKVYLVERNHYWVVLKNFPPGLILMQPLFTILRYLEQARTVLSEAALAVSFGPASHKSELMKSLLKAIFDSLRGIPGCLASDNM